VVTDRQTLERHTLPCLFLTDDMYLIFSCRRTLHFLMRHKKTRCV